MARKIATISTGMTTFDVLQSIRRYDPCDRKTVRQVVKPKKGGAYNRKAKHAARYE